MEWLLLILVVIGAFVGVGAMLGAAIGRRSQDNSLDTRVKQLDREILALKRELGRLSDLSHALREVHQEVTALKLELGRLHSQGGAAVADMAPAATEQEERQPASPPPLAEKLDSIPSVPRAGVPPKHVALPATNAVEIIHAELTPTDAVEEARGEPAQGDAVEADRAEPVTTNVLEEVNLELAATNAVEVDRVEPAATNIEPSRPESITTDALEESHLEPVTTNAVEADHVGPTATNAVEADRQEPAALNAIEADHAEPAAPPPPAMPIEPKRPDLPPREPSIFDRLFKAARDWLLGGNTVVRVGIVVLFFGVAFLLKYAADNSMLPIELRLAGVALGAIALLAIGWRIGDRRGAYGLVLQGGGVGVLYLTVFAATKLHASGGATLLPAGAAFPLMVAICALSAFLAVRQNASSLAFMGSAGGFLAPVLLASGGGSHVALFSYYAVLNAGILAIAWYKAWRPLNLLGFVFTFTISAAWGAKAYRPEYLASVEPFLILFFLMYVGIALLYALRREIALKNYVDGTLVFGTPIVTIGLQTALVKNIEFGLAWSAVALAAFYLGIATLLVRRRNRLGLMFDAMLALGVIFGTLAVPLAFTGLTTSAAWAVEGAAIVWLAVRQRTVLPLAFGLLMQLAAAFAFHAGITFNPEPAGLPVLNGTYIATLMLAVAGMFTGWWLHGRDEARNWHEALPKIGLVMAVWGLLWWIGGGIAEILSYSRTHISDDRMRFTLDAFALFAVLTAWLAHLARRRLAWPIAEWPALPLVPVIALLALSVFNLDGVQAPLTGLGWAAWPVAAIFGYLLLWRQERDVPRTLLAPLHILLFWTICGLLALEGYCRLRAYVPEGAWSWSAWAYGFGLLLLLLAGPGARLRWPIARFAQAYLVWGAAPLAALLWMWSIASVRSDGDASPLFWLPIINPLDIAQLLVVMAIATWLRRLTALGIRWRHPAYNYLALATAFLWFNALLLRAMHHFFHFDYSIHAVLTSVTLQQVLLVGWSALVFGAVWFARRETIARVFIKASAPLMLIMWLWTIYANVTQDGGAWARLPILNPLDLVMIVIYAAIAFWLRRVSRLGIRWHHPAFDYLTLGTLFLWFNAVLLRTLHYHFHVDYSVNAVLTSVNLQQVFLVGWSVFAFAAMWFVRQDRILRICINASAPLMLIMWLWTLYANFTQDGGEWARLPVLNPLDLVMIVIYAAIAFWLRQVNKLGIRWHFAAFDYLVLGTLFLWFNAVLLRTLHHHFHVDYAIHAVLTSVNLQQAFLVGWSVFAFAAMWFARQERILRICVIASAPLMLIMWLWTFYANLTQDGGDWSRLPVLNPLDLVQIVIYAIAALWLVRVNRLDTPLAKFLTGSRMQLQIAAGATGFLWLNAMLLRTVHYWADVPYRFDALTQSMVAQASISVFWTACAIVVMIWSAHRVMRAYWLIGAALLALTVVKLFLFDLWHVTGLERIVSFIGIGIMLLLIGYFSPLPPKAKQIAKGDQ